MFITHGRFVVPFEFLNAIHHFSAEFSRFVPHCVSVHVFVSQHDCFFVWANNARAFFLVGTNVMSQHAWIFFSQVGALAWDVRAPAGASIFCSRCICGSRACFRGRSFFKLASWDCSFKLYRSIAMQFATERGSMPPRGNLYHEQGNVKKAQELWEEARRGVPIKVAYNLTRRSICSRYA